MNSKTKGIALGRSAFRRNFDQRTDFKCLSRGSRIAGRVGRGPRNRVGTRCKRAGQIRGRRQTSVKHIGRRSGSKIHCREPSCRIHGEVGGRSYDGIDIVRVRIFAF